MRLIGLIVLVSTLWACSESVPRLSPLSEQAVILAFGDSLTYGTGAPKTASYPAQLDQKIAQTVINAGVPGELSQAGLKRLPSILEQYHPDLVLLFHGGNDLLQSRSQSELKQNLIQMIELIKQQGAEVVLIGIPSKSLNLKPPALYQDLATQYQIPYEATAMHQILRKSELKSDHVHPNKQGYQIIAEHIRQLLLASHAI